MKIYTGIKGKRERLGLSWKFEILYEKSLAYSMLMTKLPNLVGWGRSKL